MRSHHPARVAMVVAVALAAIGADLPEATDDLPEAADPPPAVAQSDPTSLLRESAAALAAGRYHDAVDIALPAIRAHPEQADAFEAVVLLAVDQLERRGEQVSSAPGPQVAAAPVSPYASTSVGTTLRQPGSPAMPARERTFHYGFDLGLPTGIRLEWSRPGKAVSGAGLRVGANVTTYSGVYPYPDISGYIDAHLPSTKTLELEISAGFNPMPAVGVALQHDPSGPWQFQAGMKVGIYSSFTADLGFAWMW